MLQPGDHGSTFPGGPVVAAAALAALDVLLDPRVHERVQDLGAQLLDAARRAARGSPPRADAASCSRSSSRPATRPRSCAARCSSTGSSSTRPGPTTIRLLPPLIVSDDELAEALKRLSAALEADESKA